MSNRPPHYLAMPFANAASAKTKSGAGAPGPLPRTVKRNPVANDSHLSTKHPDFETGLVANFCCQNIYTQFSASGHATGYSISTLFTGTPERLNRLTFCLATAWMAAKLTGVEKVRLKPILTFMARNRLSYIPSRFTSRD